MFELLLIIYLLPVLIIGMLLLKLVFWLLKIAIRLAVWLVKKAFILIWKLIGKHSNKCTFYSLRFGCSFAVANTIKPQLL